MSTRINCSLCAEIEIAHDIGHKSFSAKPTSIYSKAG